MKWRSASRVLCDSDCKIVHIKLKEFFYKIAIKPAMLNGTEFWDVKKQHIYKMTIVKWKYSQHIL